ncbi:histidine phosphatase family protein [Aeromicrobium massiliense]|uniref:histidine phosphatase family protein n=1 Tax=Aeromicrobium massiliense TaxID=1464554 RepID=UPI00031F5878|nr:histidine phosphatase family protein [Aeromicrobium massiliense]
MICWLRHGESTWNAAGRMQHRDPTPPLTELGRLQSRSAAEHLRGTAFDALLSSPAVRARQTAGIVADALGLEVRVDDRLVERDHDETVAEVRGRVRAVLADHPGELLVVSHGDTIAVAVELLTGRPCELPGNAQAIVTSDTLEARS